jgi:hypothetical protein
MSAPEIRLHPSGGEPVPQPTLAHFRQRTRERIYELVLQEFERSSLTQAELARRLGKNPSIISRLLSSPGNWSLDTVSDLLFAISGGELHATVAPPAARGETDDIEPPGDPSAVPPAAREPL